MKAIPHKPLLLPGEKIHVIQLRLFERDVRRHFVGVVEGFDHGVARASGYVFVIDDQTRNLFVRRPDRRTKLIAVASGNHIINVLPHAVEIERVHYEIVGHRLYVTDGADWRMDVKEFGWS